MDYWLSYIDEDPDQTIEVARAAGQDEIRAHHRLVEVGIVIDDENVSFSFHASAFLKKTTVQHLAAPERSCLHRVCLQYKASFRAVHSPFGGGLSSAIVRNYEFFDSADLNRRGAFTPNIQSDPWKIKNTHRTICSSTRAFHLLAQLKCPVARRSMVALQAS